MTIFSEFGDHIPALGTDSVVQKAYGTTTLDNLITAHCRMARNILPINQRIIAKHEVPRMQGRTAFLSLPPDVPKLPLRWVSLVTYLHDPIEDELSNCLHLRELLAIIKSDAADVPEACHLIINIPLAHNIEILHGIVKKFRGIDGHYTMLRLERVYDSSLECALWSAQLYDSLVESVPLELYNAVAYPARGYLSELVLNFFSGMAYHGVNYLGMQINNHKSCGFWVAAMIKADLTHGAIKPELLLPIDPEINEILIDLAKDPEPLASEYLNGHEGDEKVMWDEDEDAIQDEEDSNDKASDPGVSLSGETATDDEEEHVADAEEKQQPSSVPKYVPLPNINFDAPIPQAPLLKFTLKNAYDNHGFSVQEPELTIAVHPSEPVVTSVALSEQNRAADIFYDPQSALPITEPEPIFDEALPTSPPANVADPILFAPSASLPAETDLPPETDAVEIYFAPRTPPAARMASPVFFTRFDLPANREIVSDLSDAKHDLSSSVHLSFDDNPVQDPGAVDHDGLSVALLAEELPLPVPAFSDPANAVLPSAQPLAVAANVTFFASPTGKSLGALATMSAGALLGFALPEIALLVGLSAAFAPLIGAALATLIGLTIYLLSTSSPEAILPSALAVS